MLQEGIFHAPGTHPPSNFGVMFLRVVEGVNARDVGMILTDLWQLYQELKVGKVRELPGIEMPSGNLNVSIGFGPNVFDLEGVGRAIPDGLSAQYRFRSVSPGGGNRLLIGGGLNYEAGLTKNPATEEVVIQFLGDTPLTVNRPMVETWKALQETVDPLTGTPAMEITAFFTGFHREDRRSWIDFHDGLSNPIKGQQRSDVVTIKSNDTSTDDAWTVGGSYMTYMRLPVRLDLWNALSRREQELLVGRDKVTGCAISDIDDGGPRPQIGCPFNGTTQVTDAGNEAFREPPAAVPDEISKSHVQRANHHRRDFENRESLRIYRQGYEFVESTVNGLPRVGLNFVSFQDTPFRIRELLTRPTWFGGVNFGGDEAVSLKLIEVAAAGIYLLPPVQEAEAFPGASIFSGILVNQ